MWHKRHAPDEQKKKAFSLGKRGDLNKLHKASNEIRLHNTCEPIYQPYLPMITNSALKKQR